MERAEEDSSSSKFTELYKFTNGKRTLDQEGRKKQFLENVRLRRNEVFNQNRNFEDEDFQEVEEMDISVPNREKKKLKCYSYANMLMLSDWLTEVPPNLEKNWLVKLCPFDQRRLVVAKNNTTVAYNKYGKKKDEFLSRLPGSIQSQTSCGSQPTILDCIYNHQVDCYFVLDVLVWNGNSMEESETDFRFFFIKSKLNEMPELRTIDNYNHRIFIEIEGFSATRALIEEKVTYKYIVNDKAVLLDGALFYHKESLYTAGKNSLIGWLKPRMLTSLLNVTVPYYYLEEDIESILETNRKNKNFNSEELLSNMLNNMRINN